MDNETALTLNKNGFWYRYYPNTHMFNVEDEVGRIHSFYASTGTIALRKNKDSKEQKFVKDSNIDKFMWYLNDAVRIDEVFM